MSTFKTSKWNLILTACICMLVGAILIFFPEITAKALALTLAIFLFGIGAVRIISYFARDPESTLFQYDLVLGLIAILAGLFIVLRTEEIIALLPFLLGFAITISGFLKLQNAINLLRVKDRSWPFILILSLLNIALGIVLLANPFEAATTLIMLLGIGMIYSGLSDLITICFVSHRVRVFSKAAFVDPVITAVDDAPTTPTALNASDQPTDDAPTA
jgi:uncharacterized membrane protein HdeD (DUF308 family)